MVPLTLLINGFGPDFLLKAKDGGLSLAVKDGCTIGLDTWYISFTGLCGIKLLI